MRLDRYIANATGISRRLVHREIKSGNVFVDGLAAKSFSQNIESHQSVSLQGKAVQPASHLYLMLHKPLGVVCANTDSEHPTVIDLLDGAKEAKHPTEAMQIAGRLDRDTTGLVLLTTDGQWNHTITAPSSNCKKTYIVGLAETISQDDISRLEAGIHLKSEKKPSLPCKIKQLSDKQLKIELSEGKYHQVKRMFAAVGNKVTQLHRERIGSIHLPVNLQAGEFRALTPNEIVSIND